MATGVRITVTGATRVADGLASLGADAAVAIASEVRAHAVALQQTVRRNATTGFHRPGLNHIPGTGPGPNVATGEYLRSIAVDVAPGGQTADVYTEAVQALRLEYGFHGQDSLGRAYRAPAYPHWQPAADVIEPLFVEAVDAAVAHLIDRT